MLVSLPVLINVGKPSPNIKLELIQFQCDNLLKEKLKIVPILDLYATLNEVKL